MSTKLAILKLKLRLKKIEDKIDEIIDHLDREHNANYFESDFEIKPLQSFEQSRTTTHPFCSECIFRNNCTDDIEECKEATRVLKQRGENDKNNAQEVVREGGV